MAKRRRLGLALGRRRPSPDNTRSMRGLIADTGEPVSSTAEMRRRPPTTNGIVIQRRDGWKRAWIAISPVVDTDELFFGGPGEFLA